MFSFSDLNDYEFEKLAADVLTVLLGRKFFSFPRGRDGGIDLCDNPAAPKFVAQCKHYSDVSALFAALRKEKEKVAKISPERYFVVTGLSLTRERKREIAELFAPAMRSAEDVIDGEVLNAFLAEERARDIVFRHYKLWLNAANVLQAALSRGLSYDGEAYLEDAKAKSPRFVCTEAFFKAKEKLEKYGVVLLIGTPGTGKSTLSQMLVLDLIRRGYDFRYSSNNDISELKRTLSPDPAAKEAILLDDFVGQHFYDLHSSAGSEIKTLVSLARRTEKKLILNSRITILNEARERDRTLGELIDANEESKSLILVSDMTRLERAKILYNHLCAEGVPAEYRAELVKERRYLEIIDHRNYNPRVISYIARRKNYASVPPKNISDM